MHPAWDAIQRKILQYKVINLKEVQHMYILSSTWYQQEADNPSFLELYLPLNICHGAQAIPKMSRCEGWSQHWILSPLYMAFKGKLIQNPNAGILQKCFFSDHDNKKESQMGFKAQNTVLNPKRGCANWADQTLDCNFKRRPRGVS